VQGLKDEVVPMLGDPAGEVVVTEERRMMGIGLDASLLS